MLDPTDTQIIRCLQDDGRASWTQIAKHIGIPTSTAFRRGNALLDNGIILVGALPTRYPEQARIYDLRVRCRPSTQRSVAHELAHRSDTRWVAVITGEYDVAAEIVVADGQDLAELLIDQVQHNPDVLATDTALVLAEHVVFNDWPRHYADQQGPQPPRHICSPDHLDATDRAVLAQLRENGRASYAAVAAALDLSENTVRRRCTEMFTKGCASIITLVQPSSLGYHEELLMRLDIHPRHVDEAIATLSAQNGVHHVSSTWGTTSLTCELMLPSPQDVRTFQREVIAQLPGLNRMTAEIELIVYKRGFLLSPWMKQQTSSQPTAKND
ncbi:Lrp/AsnC family transcriptional regulator [Streptomyces antibioticus]|uniref:Lrp/AsnC family transcriptional regulator n=1 Tax=Streptomyces antibioticus TaxID=1890 RepID=UPI0033B7DEE5